MKNVPLYPKIIQMLFGLLLLVAICRASVVTLDIYTGSCPPYLQPAMLTTPAKQQFAMALLKECKHSCARIGCPDKTSPYTWVLDTRHDLDGIRMYGGSDAESLPILCEPRDISDTEDDSDSDDQTL